MRRFLQGLSVALFCLAGTSFLGWLCSAGAGASRVEIDQAGLWGVRVVAGRPLDLAFRVSNRGRSDLTVVGAEEYCGREGCVEVPGLPTTIPAGGSRSIVVEYSSVRPGDFVMDFSIYTDDPVDQQIHLSVKGVVVGDADSRQ
ncbi:MAG: DUF1573 domain-containing protein [Isosphaeraceae bacterium]